VSIAGHDFNLEGKCSCGKRLVDLLVTTEDGVGKMEIAHSGSLTRHEFNQIEAERDRIWELVAIYASSGRRAATEEFGLTE
jgi:hypothetical protein